MDQEFQAGQFGVEGPDNELGKEKTSGERIEVSCADAAETGGGGVADLGHRRALQRQLARKVDVRLMPIIMIIFILNYIDRNALAAARLKGLEADLKLTTVQYESALAILYAAYSPFQIPSNMILNAISRPSWYIGGCTILWGVVSALTGTVTNWSGLMAVRFFIGLPESAFYVGSMYLLSRWYTQAQRAKRAALLYVGLLTSNAFGSLVAAGILSNMEGSLGHPAWRWLFWIEGAITIFIGILALWILPDYPHNTTFLTPAERLLVQQMLAEEAGEADKDASDESFVYGLKLALQDKKVWLFMIGTLAQLLGLSFTNFFPTLTATLGYGTTQTLLLAAPPWVFTSLVCVVNAWHSDRVKERYWHLTWEWWATIVGYVIGLVTMNTGARYVSLFLMAVGYSGFALTLVNVADAVPRPPAKRAAAMGIVNGIGNLGNVCGSYVWKASWGPGYHQSMIVCLASLCIALCCFTAVRQILVAENKRLDRAELGQGGDAAADANRERVEEFARIEGISIEKAKARRRGFRYTT